MEVTSKFAGAQVAADGAVFSYLCNDLMATVAPSQSSFAKAFDSAPSQAAREAVTKNAARNGFIVGGSPAPSQSAAFKVGTF